MHQRKWKLIKSKKKPPMSTCQGIYIGCNNAQQFEKKFSKQHSRAKVLLRRHQELFLIECFSKCHFLNWGILFIWLWIFLTMYWVLLFQMQFWSKSACTASFEHAPLASQSKIWSFIWTSLIRILHLWTSSSCEKPLTRKLITIQVSVLLREDNNRSHLISQSWRLDETSRSVLVH